jgi:hypothetical protein
MKTEDRRKIHANSGCTGRRDPNIPSFDTAHPLVVKDPSQLANHLIDDPRFLMLARCGTVLPGDLECSKPGGTPKSFGIELRRRRLCNTLFSTTHFSHDARVKTNSSRGGDFRPGAPQLFHQPYFNG